MTITTQGHIEGKEGRYAVFYPANPSAVNACTVPTALWKLHGQQVTVQIIGHTVVSVETDDGQRWQCNGERLEVSHDSQA